MKFNFHLGVEEQRAIDVYDEPIITTSQLEQCRAAESIEMQTMCSVKEELVCLEEAPPVVKQETASRRSLAISLERLMPLEMAKISESIRTIGQIPGAEVIQNDTLAAVHQKLAEIDALITADTGRWHGDTASEMKRAGPNYWSRTIVESNLNNSNPAYGQKMAVKGCSARTTEGVMKKQATSKSERYPMQEALAVKQSAAMNVEPGGKGEAARMLKAVPSTKKHLAGITAVTSAVHADTGFKTTRPAVRPVKQVDVAKASGKVLENASVAPQVTRFTTGSREQADVLLLDGGRSKKTDGRAGTLLKFTKAENTQTQVQVKDYGMREQAIKRCSEPNRQKETVFPCPSKEMQHLKKQEAAPCNHTSHQGTMMHHSPAPSATCEVDRRSELREECVTSRGIMWRETRKSCHECGQKWHLQRDCPELRCKYCLAYGHFARQCPAARCSLCGELGHFRNDCVRDPSEFYPVRNRKQDAQMKADGRSERRFGSGWRKEKDSVLRGNWRDHFVEADNSLDTKQKELGMYGRETKDSKKKEHENANTLAEAYTWYCKKCGQHNKQFRVKCFRCMRDRPLWTCRSCDSQNGPGQTRCTGCKKANPLWKQEHSEWSVCSRQEARGHQ